MRPFSLLLTFLGIAAQISGQVGSPRFAQPSPAQDDRAEDSYAIYSLLLKSGPIEWRDASRTQWLIEDTTDATSLDEACRSARQADPLSINPHEAVRAPADRQTEWSEVLADYDQHCHNVIELERERFRTELPVHLWNAADKHNFMKDSRNLSSPKVLECIGSRKGFSTQTICWHSQEKACGAVHYSEIGRVVLEHKRADGRFCHGGIRSHGVLVNYALNERSVR